MAPVINITFIDTLTLLSRYAGAEIFTYPGTELPEFGAIAAVLRY